MKTTVITTTALALAALLCTAPGSAWADGRGDHGWQRDRHARASQSQHERHEHSARREERRRLYADDDSNRRYPRLGTDRDNKGRSDNRRSRQEHSRPAPNRANPRLGYDRGDRRDERRDDRRKQTLPPSRVYRPVQPEHHEYIYRQREHEREVYRRAPKNWVLDRRYRHDRYYPPRGHVVRTLPRDHRIVHYHGTSYYYWSGIWYRPSGATYIVVSPPLGVVVPFLPLFYTTLWVHGMPYYYADNVYYRYSPADSGYVVVEAPDNGSSTQPVQPQDELYVYPMKGQSQEQQASDRYECHHWAVGQTNFDPTQPPQGLSPDQFAQRRAEYLRAMRACLEGRGYSVK